jgi:hypothetical protein
MKYFLGFKKFHDTKKPFRDIFLFYRHKLNDF